jgi:hypothetical protein
MLTTFHSLNIHCTYQVQCHCSYRESRVTQRESWAHIILQWSVFPCVVYRPFASYSLAFLVPNPVPKERVGGRARNLHFVQLSVVDFCAHWRLRTTFLMVRLWLNYDSSWYSTSYSIKNGQLLQWKEYFIFLK